MALLADVHCHLDDRAFSEDIGAVLERASAAGVKAVVCNGISPESNRAVLALSHAYPLVKPALGLYPIDALKLSDEEIAKEIAWIRSQRCVAIGEVGLDYHRDVAPRDGQETGFRAQLALARRLGLPVVIHDREAHADVMRVLGEAAEGVAVLLHSFSGDEAMAREAWARGYYTGVSSRVTYPKADAFRALLRAAPRDRILLETDAPYQAPAGRRGRRCEPADIVHPAAPLADLWGIPLGEIARTTTANARRFFRLPEP